MFSTTPATNDPLTGASASFRKKAADSFRLYRHYFMIQLKSAMQYKTSFFLTCMGQFLVSFNVFIGIYFMFRRFHTVKGYSYKEVLLCFGITLMEFGLAEVFARGFDTFASIIGNGVFDRIMVRPRGLIFQVLGQRIEFTRIGRMIQATVMFAYGLAAGGVVWSPAKVFTVLFMLAGGAALFSGIFLIYAAICFFTLEGLEFMNVLTDGAREYGNTLWIFTGNGSFCSLPFWFLMPASSIIPFFFFWIAANGGTACFRQEVSFF